jgi:pyruvate/2-oxoacid:ferredoxin oxidoreductase alpha subunit
MPAELVTGNHAAGYALSTAAEANRHARGATCGIYPITPQTEIVEYVARFPFTKTQVVPVESEHSAMGVSIGASLAGARAFTASSSNGIAYMVENIMVAGFYRLPIVMVAVNRTLGPPWNIWADQGDTLMLRDFPWICWTRHCSPSGWLKTVGSCFPPWSRWTRSSCRTHRWGPSCPSRRRWIATSRI